MNISINISGHSTDPAVTIKTDEEQDVAIAEMDAGATAFDVPEAEQENEVTTSSDSLSAIDTGGPPAALLLEIGEAETSTPSSMTDVVDVGGMAE